MNKKYISLQEASKGTPYSQEYLSLLARKGKLFSIKLGRNWYTTREAIDGYLRRQSVTIAVPKNLLKQKQVVASLVQSFTPEEPEEGELGFAFGEKGVGHEKHSKMFEEFERLNPRIFNQTKTEEKKTALKEIYNKITQPQQPTQQSGPQLNLPVVQQILPSEHLELDNSILNKLDKLSDSLGVFAEKITAKVSELPETNSGISAKDKEFLKLESSSLGYRFRRFNKYTNSLVRTPVRMTAVMIAAIVTLFLAAGGFSFGQADYVVQQIKKAFKDADTLQGYFPGTHANEVLVLDKAGNISIFGHIETRGQLRSYAPTGVAPIVVDSITKVENLNADYIDDLDSKDFTLAFVTKNGNITYEDVFLEGNVEVGKTLTVKGAAKLLSSLQVYGTLGVFSEAFFSKDVNLTGGNLVLEKGTIKISNTSLIKNLNAEFLDGLRKGDITLDFVTDNGASTTNGISVGALDVNGNVDIGGSFKVGGQSDFYGMGFFHAGVWGKDGMFGTLGVAGDATIGNKDKSSNSNFQVYSKKFIVDEIGNITASGKIKTVDLAVSGTVQSDLIPSGSFNLGSSTNKWQKVFAVTATIDNLVVSGSANFAGTSSSSFRINTDNVSSDSESAYLSFERGTTTPNATLKWNSTNKRFEFNEPLFIASSSLTTFSVSGGPSSLSNTLYVQNSGNVGIGTTAPSSKLEVLGRATLTNLEVQGTASASYLLTGNTLQVGGFATVSYSRFGTSTTGHSNYISAANDLLISGDLETRGTASFGGVASVSGNFFTYGTNTFSGTGSSSFAGSLLISKGLNAQAIVGTALTINGNASITGNTILGDATGDTVTSNADAWTFANDTNFTLSGGVNGLSFDTSTLSIDAANDRVGIRTTTPTTTLEVQGTASASYLLTGNTLQVGGFASVAYSRFGVATATSAEIDTINDLLIVGALEVDGNAFFDGKASISSNFQTAGRFIFGNNSATGEINTNDWDISAAGALTGVAFDANGTGNSITNIDNADLTADTLDFTAILDNPTLDASLNISRAGFFIGLGAAPGTVFEVQGTASASYLLTGNTLQVGGFASVAYSRFGTTATTHSNYISTTNDLLINGDLEVDASVAFDSHVAIGDATDGTDLVYINSQVKSNFIPFTNAFNIGSTTNRWQTGFFDKVDATEFSGASVSFGGTNNETFTINADNATADTENSQFVFERGDPTTNAQFQWDATNKRFNLNFPVFVQTADPSETANNFTKLTLKGATDQGSNDYFEIQNSGGSRLLLVEQGGRLIASGSFQAGGASVASVSYSRFGTSTTGHSNYISAANDLLISGDLETRGTASFGGVASVSGNFFTYGTNTFSGTGSSSFAGSLLISKGLNAQAIVGTALTINGNASITGNTILGDATGDTVTSNADAWTFANDTNFTLSGGVNGLSFDTNTLSIDAANDRVGIRTTVPSTTFEVQGTASASYLLTGNTLQVGGFASVAYSRFGTVATTHSLSASNDILINGKLEVDGSAYFDGTVNFSTIASSSLFYAGNGTSSSPSFSFAIDQDTGMFRRAINALGFSTLGAERLTIDSAGNVGIGTTAPLTKFEVQGTASASNLLTVGSLQVANGGATVSYSRFGTSTTGHSNYISAANDLLISGDLETRGTASFGGVASVSGNFFTYGTNTFSGTGSSSFAGSLDISKGLRVGANTALNVNANASANTLVLVGGNVGIGTTGPVAKLNIAGDMQFTFQSSTNRTINIASNGISDPVNLILNGSDGTNDDGNVILATIGKVGIGTTGPSSLLTVQGRGEFQGTASASYLLTGNTLQVGGFASVAYSRFGTATLTANPAGNWITGSNDLLISGDLYGVGSIAFAGTASISNTLFVGTGGKTGNVGIGTTAPALALHIVGDIKIDSSSATGQPFIDFSQAGSRLSFIQHLDSGDNLRFVSEFGAISSWTGTAGVEVERMRIDSSGNIGIGTTSPDSLFELSSAATNFIVRSTGSTSSASIDFQPAGGASASNQGKFTIRAGGLASTLGERLEFLNGNMTSLMTIASSGNVGIGTTVPGHKLDVSVSGTASPIQGLLEGILISNTNTTQSALSGLQFNTYDSGGTIRHLGAIVSGKSDAWTAADSTTWDSFLSFWTRNNGANEAEAMRIDSSGNIGIGTTSPDSLFELSSAATNFIVRSTGSTSSASIDFQPAGGASASNQGKFTIRAGGLASTLGERLEFLNGNMTSLMTIASSGNVGIGTTVPDQALELSGATAPKFALSDTGLAHGVTGLAQTDTFLQLEQVTDNDGGGRVLGFSDSVGQDPLRLVGVFGSTDPTDTVPGVWVIGAKKSGGVGSAALADAETVFGISNNGAANDLIVLGNGNVGIGTSAPTANLNVAGADSLTIPIIIITAGTGGAAESGMLEINGRADFGYDGVRAAVLISDSETTKHIVFDTAGTERMRISSGGNVGIGTTAPTALLHGVGPTPASVGTSPGTAANDVFTLTGGVGGATSIATTGVGGIGGEMRLTMGAGGVANSATTLSTGGVGGLIVLTGGAGGASAVSSSNGKNGGVGGVSQFISGAGGAATGAGTGTNTGGAGGLITIQGGSGGAANTGTGSLVSGTGGGINIVGGTGGVGTSGTATGGNGGLIQVLGGSPAGAMEGAAGGAVSIQGRGGSSTGSGGAGGNLTLIGGASGGDDTVNRAGGNIAMTAGVSQGTQAGGAWTFTGGDSGDNQTAGTATGGIGGAITYTMGDGGTASLATVAATGGAGGTFTITGGVGGAGSVAGTGTNTGGAGSLFSWIGGAGGAANGVTSGTNTGGTGGAITIRPGTGGAATAGSGSLVGGTGGLLTLQGGTGGAGSTIGTGGGASLVGGTSGISTGTGGNVTMSGGLGGASGTGGDLIFRTAATNSLSTRMTIIETGNVGIGTTAPTTLFDVIGNASVSAKFELSGLTVATGTPSSICQNATSKEITVNAALTCTVSARDQKMNISSFSSEVSALDLTMALNPVEFAYKDRPERMRWGFIADEVQAVNPKLGDGYVNGEARTIDIAGLIALNTKAIQELNAKVGELEDRVASSSSNITVSSGGGLTVYADPLVDLASAALVKFQNIWAKGDVITEGVKKTYYSVADAFDWEFDLDMMASNWNSREITFASDAGAEISSLFSGSAAQAADESKLDLKQENNGAYLASYGVDSARGEIILSGSSEISGGEAKIFFDFSFTSVISGGIPLKVLLTPTTSMQGQLYVANKTPYGFVVKSFNGPGDGKFDWLVIARRKGYEGADLPTQADTTQASPSPSITPSPSPEPTPSPSMDSEASPLPSVATPEPSPSPTPKLEPTLELTPEPSPPPLMDSEASPLPSVVTPEPSPSPEITPEPSPSPIPQATPESSPSPEPLSPPLISPSPEV